MGSLVAALAVLDDLVDTLNSEGINADVDESELSYPGVLVRPVSIDPTARLDGAGDVLARLTIAVPDHNPGVAAAELLAFADKVMEVIDADPGTRLEFRTFLSHQGPLPALQFVRTLHT